MINVLYLDFNSINFNYSIAKYVFDAFKVIFDLSLSPFYFFDKKIPLTSILMALIGLEDALLKSLMK